MQELISSNLGLGIDLTPARRAGKNSIPPADSLNRKKTREKITAFGLPSPAKERRFFLTSDCIEPPTL
jgi:hypothetical protein